MAKAKEELVSIPQAQTVFCIYKDGGEDTWAQAYGVIEIEIDKDALIKYGKVKSKTNPDMLQVALSQLKSKVCDLFGL